MKFVLFDFEVFKEDWLVVFKYPASSDHIVIVNDSDKLKKFFDDNKKNIFVGYNNNHYDNFILKAILNDINPYRVSKWIIGEKKTGWQFPNINNKYFYSLDLMQDISGALGISLKEIECNLGISIEESEVDFNINRELTEEEIEETIFYCKHDVDATEKLMEVRSDYIKAKLQLINIFNLSMKCMSMTNAQINAEIMHARKKDYDDGLNYDAPNNLLLNDKSVLELYKTPLNRTDYLLKDICGVEHKLAFGGLHGAREHYNTDDSNGELLNVDVTLAYNMA